MVERAGLTGLTFQALADTLGVSKQAILYWYPSKWELIADCGVPILRQEADALIGGRRRAYALKGSLSLVCTEQQMLKIFRITGLDKVFTIHDTVDEAVSARAVAS